jgi:hypothetical protein
MAILSWVSQMFSSRKNISTFTLPFGVVYSRNSVKLLFGLTGFIFFFKFFELLVLRIKDKESMKIFSGLLLKFSLDIAQFFAFCKVIIGIRSSGHV